MGRSRNGVIDAGVAAGIALIGTAMLLNGGPSQACPAIGYADISPIELRIDPAMGVAAVAACFGRDCPPVRLTPDDDGGWSVPQSPEYLQGPEPGSVTEVTVVASSNDVTLVDDVFQIEHERAEGGGLWRQCPGPMRHLPVYIDTSSEAVSTD